MKKVRMSGEVYNVDGTLVIETDQPWPEKLKEGTRVDFEIEIEEGE